MAEHPLSGRQARVTKLQRAPEGFWTARISLGGVTRNCDRKCGSWMTTVRIGPGRGDLARQCVLPEFAAILQEHVKRAEKREARNGRDGHDSVTVPPAPHAEVEDRTAPPSPGPAVSSGPGLNHQRKESAMPTTPTAEPQAAPKPPAAKTNRSEGTSPSKRKTMMSRIEAVLNAADGPMDVQAIADAIPAAAFNKSKTHGPYYQVYGRLHASVKQGKVVKVEKGVFDLAELNPRGAKKRPSK